MELFNPATRPAACPMRCSTWRFADGRGGTSLRPQRRVSGNTNEPMPSPPLPPRDRHALVARDGFRALAGGAKLE